MRIGSNDSPVVVPATPPDTAGALAEVEERAYFRRSLVKDRGHELLATKNSTVQECKTICDHLQECQSFSFSALLHTCHFQDNAVPEDAQAVEQPYLDFETYAVAIDLATISADPAEVPTPAAVERTAAEPAEVPTPAAIETTSAEPAEVPAPALTPASTPEPVAQNCLPAGSPPSSEFVGFEDDEFRGWYDVQGCGRCHDYCLWTGTAGPGGDPQQHLVYDKISDYWDSSHWVCLLAGSSTYEPMSNYMAWWHLTRCDGEGASAPPIAR